MIKSCRKIAYASEKDALNEINNIKKKNKGKNKKIPHKTYFCKCGVWHLTSQVSREDILILKLKQEIKELKDKINTLNVDINNLKRASNINSNKDSCEIISKNEFSKNIVRLRKDIDSLISQNIELKKKLNNI